MTGSVRWIVVALGTGASAIAIAPAAHADQLAYLVNVHARPGYTFPDAQTALAYGYSVCDRVEAKVAYTDLVNQVDSDENNTDPYQAGYLINQAVNELCPADIWQLRQAAASR